MKPKEKSIRDLFSSSQIPKRKTIKESIIDPPHKEKAKFLFDEKGKVKKEVKKQIYGILRDWKKQINFDFEIESIHLKGSLLGYQWNSEADLDVSVKTTMSKEQIEEISKILPDGNFLKVNGEDTLHPIDFFFLDKDSDSGDLQKYDYLYDLDKNEWIKQSEKYSSDLSVNYVLKVGEFFIDGIFMAMGNAEKDMMEYKFYESIVSGDQDFEEEERKKLLARKYEVIKTDLEQLRLSKFIFLSLRREGYREGEKIPFKISFEEDKDNPHTLFGEVFQKSLERMKIRENLEEKIEKVTEFLEDNKSIDDKETH